MAGAIDVFSERGSAAVTAGGATAPAAGTAETWTVASSTLPSASNSASPPTQFKVADPQLPGETILCTNTSGSTLAVTRGVDGTTPVAHSPGFTIQQVISKSTATAFRTVGWLNVVNDFGADPTGATDSTAAFQAAINALPSGGGVVYVPGVMAGVGGTTYTLNAGHLTVVSGLQLVGDGYQATTINCTFSGTGGYLFNLDPPAYSSSNHVEDLVITGLTINCTNADIFWGANIVRSRIVGNYLHQNSTGNAIMNVSASTGQGNGYIAECEFANKEMVGNGRTIESWHLDESATTLRCNDNVWHGGGCKIWTGTGAYWLRLVGDGSTLGSKHNTFRDLIFENSGGSGGHIWMQNTSDSLIDNISCEDLSSGTLSNPLILLNTFSSGPGCQGIKIRSYSRRSGSAISGSLPDIKLDGNATSITIDSPSESSAGTQLTIDLQSATNIALTGAWPTSYSLLNVASNTLSFAATNSFYALSANTSSQSVTAGGTTITINNAVNRLSLPSGSQTGAILTAGSVTGQIVTLINQSGSNTLTFAASATSNVADGTSDVIAANTARSYVWDSGTAFWYRRS